MSEPSFKLSSFLQKKDLVIWLRLGRVSNLPTVWSNVLVGVCLGLFTASTLTVSWLSMVVVVVLLWMALTAFYVGGMFLNDAFDAAIDAHERPERPIPAGQVSRITVFIAGGGLQVAGICLVYVAASLATGKPLIPTLFASLLAFTIVLYNAWHKGNPVSPLLMALCRVLVYLTCAATVTGLMLTQPLILACLCMLVYLSGLTAIAKQENLNQLSGSWPLLLLFLPIPLAFLVARQFHWLPLLTGAGFIIWVVLTRNHLARGGAGVIGQSVARLIAGISLLDMLIVAALFVTVGSGGIATGSFAMVVIVVVLCLFCLACFLLTRRWQQQIPGT